METACVWRMASPLLDAGWKCLDWRVAQKIGVIRSIGGLICASNEKKAAVRRVPRAAVSLSTFGMRIRQPDEPTVPSNKAGERAGFRRSFSRKKTPSVLCFAARFLCFGFGQMMVAFSERIGQRKDFFCVVAMRGDAANKGEGSAKSFSHF